MFSGKLEEYLECIATYRYSGDLTEEVRLNKSKLLSLLNGIALLLVSNAKKDVAAVSHALTQTSTDAIIQVYYCKNSGCTDKDRQMVDKLVTLCRHLASNQEEDMFGEEMWSLIASHCRHKIDRRGAKVASAWKLIEDVTLDFGIPTDDGFELLREITDDSSLNKDTWGPWLRGYLASFNERLSSHQSMQKTVGIASVLLEIRKVNFQISEILRRRLRKLTQYTKVVASLKLDIRRYNRRGLSLIIRTSEIPAPTCSQFHHSQSPREVLENVARTTLSKGLIEPLTAHWIREKNLSISENSTRLQYDVPMLQHCECTLAMAMVKCSQVPEDMSIAIGVSKACCWPCATFLAENSQLGSQILISYSHRKTYRGWQFPGIEAHEHIYERMVNLARVRLCNFLEHLRQRALSDSHCGSSPEPDDDDMQKEIVIQSKAKK